MLQNLYAFHPVVYGPRFMNLAQLNVQPEDLFEQRSDFTEFLSGLDEYHLGTEQGKEYVQKCAGKRQLDEAAARDTVKDLAMVNSNEYYGGLPATAERPKALLAFYWGQQFILDELLDAARFCEGSMDGDEIQSYYKRISNQADKVERDNDLVYFNTALFQTPEAEKIYSEFHSNYQTYLSSKQYKQAGQEISNMMKKITDFALKNKYQQASLQMLYSQGIAGLY